MSYVDLHLHLLPGVDDGAPDEAAALAYARRLAAEGVRDVTVTPHINRYWPLEIATIPERVAALAAALEEQASACACGRRRARRALRARAD